MKTTLTAEQARALFDYDPETGVLTHKLLQSKACRASGVAGTFSTGVQQLRIEKKGYLAHRVIWLWMTGAWPSRLIDHIDGNRLNNAWTNLRDVSDAVNVHNIHVVPRHNKHSGLLGAHWCKQRQLWKSSIKVGGVVCHLGVFPTAEEASEAYIAAKQKKHPGFSPLYFQEAACAQL